MPICRSCDPKDATRKLLDLTRTLSTKHQETKSSYKTSVASLCTNKNLLRKNQDDTSQYIYTYTYLGANLTKEMKDLYYKNFKTVKKETEEDTR